MADEPVRIGGGGGGGGIQMGHGPIHDQFVWWCGGGGGGEEGSAIYEIVYLPDQQLFEKETFNKSRTFVLIRRG